MGFSLMFMRTDRDAQADGDREALRAFLDSRGLQVKAGPYGGEIVDTDDKALTFDGHFTDLSLDPLDKDEPISGGIDHATLSDQECAFIYDLCIAAGFLIVNPQGEPLFIVPGGNHTADQVPDGGEVAWVTSPAELVEALSGNFQRFLDFKRQVIGD